MILGVNGIRLVGQRSGVARCIEAILWNLGEIDHPFREIRVYSPKPIANEVVLPGCANNVVLASTAPPAIWEQFTLLKAHGPKNVLFCPSYVIPLLARCPTFLIHHGSYEGYPQAFNWWALNKARMAYAASAKRATVVCTVSEYSKRDMVRFYGLRPERVHVVPDGVDTRCFRPIQELPRLAEWRVRTFGSDVPFIVYVGKPTERRNLTLLIQAFAALKRENGIPHKLLIVGADLPGTSPFRLVIAREHLEDEVIVLGYLGHDEMPMVYNAADLLVYPSSYEGFGMPVLEAMACGAPVIALNNTAFPEFAGGIAHLLPNAQIATLKEGIHAVLSDAAWREKMAREGPKRAAAYDWRLVTRRYLDLMLPLAESRKVA
ncbi:MAG TPA: glycosyltransferase family 1 protein [Bryobacteraceae bacterium]|jgi:glycosyltransferase involved in cell wall biosynthesis|nr:glycosyltransferase family 1 protein [Bryobacteraceae bacterium]